MQVQEAPPQDVLLLRRDMGPVLVGGWSLPLPCAALKARRVG